MKKPYVDPFPNLPRRFGSFREIDTPAERPRALTGAKPHTVIVDDIGPTTKPAKAAKKATKRKPKRKATK